MAGLTIDTANARRPDRSYELDGLRGWASLCVVTFHMTWEVFGEIHPGWRNHVTSFLLDGRLAVCIFFVLSGEALSSPFFRSGNERSIIRLAIKRYSRLTVPIFFTALLTFLIKVFGLNLNTEAGSIVRRSDWLGSWLSYPADLPTFMKYCFVLVYTAPPAEFNIPFLWTMVLEILGSYLVFLYLLIFPKVSRPWMLLAFIMFILTLSDPNTRYYSCFAAGIYFAHLRRIGFFATAAENKIVITISWLLILVIGYADAHVEWTRFHNWAAPISVLLVFLFFVNSQISYLLTREFSQRLGRIAFNLYLIQFPVLITFTSYMIVLAHRTVGLGNAVSFGIALTSIFFSLLIAYFCMPVETITRRVGDWVVSLVGVPVRDAQAPGSRPV